jgi:hypothetical protein
MSFSKKKVFKKQLKILKEINIYNIRENMTENNISIYNKNMYKIK